MAEDSDEELSQLFQEALHGFQEAIQVFKTEMYDPEECEDILNEEKSKVLATFKSMATTPENDSSEVETLERQINKLIASAKDTNNTKFWFVENTLDECMDTALTFYKNSVEKRYANQSSLTPEEFSELQLALESESLAQFDHRVLQTKDLPPTEVQISRHQLRKEIQELAAEDCVKYREQIQTQIQTAITSSEEKAKKIILEKINRFTTQFDIVSYRDFHAELARIRKSTFKQIENEMFIENHYNEPSIFKIIDKLEANLHDFGGQHWTETLVFSNQEGQARIQEKMTEIKEHYRQNLNSKKTYQRKVFVQSERNPVVAEFMTRFSFSDADDEDNLRERLENELRQVERDVGPFEEKEHVVTELTQEEYL